MVKFERARDWVGFKVNEGEVGKYLWCDNRTQSEKDILFGINNARCREDCIKAKLENYCNINAEDVKIFEHYVTTGNGVILWFRTERHISDEIFRIAPPIRSQDFGIRTFIPEIARLRKQKIDKTLLTYKEEKNQNLRYYIKNGRCDLELFCKDGSTNSPYRRMDISMLGSIPKLKLNMKEKEAEYAVNQP